MGGGGGGGSTVDKEYNKRLAKISERQMAMSEEYMDFWRQSYRPLEEARAAANLELIPGQTGLAKEQIETGMQFQRAAREGVDPEAEADVAQAGVEHAFKGSTESMARGISRFGLDPTSGRFADVARQTSMAKAKGIAGARSGARRYAGEESFRRLGMATGGLG